MDHTMQDLMKNLKSNQSALRSVIASQDGQALIRQLTQGDGGTSLQHAAQSASHGDTAELAAMINKLMGSREGAELIQRINNSLSK